jgi:hypothetical protein
MPNVIIMRVDYAGQKMIIGGYSSHGWLREDMITENVGGMDLTMRFGGDDTCFLFNLTHNLRFDSIKNGLSAQGVDIMVYAATTMAYEGDLSNISEEGDEIEEEEDESNLEDSNSEMKES